MLLFFLQGSVLRSLSDIDDLAGAFSKVSSDINFAVLLVNDINFMMIAFNKIYNYSYARGRE